MALAMKVPSMACQDCATTITEAIKTVDDQAHVNIDLATKQVRVESQASESSIKQAITATGYAIEGY